MTWVDWLKFVLAPLLIAILGAIVATRNAKKTPHERLKNLVEIRSNLPENLDSKKVVDAAIARELVDFDRRVTADQRGFWAGLEERAIQHPAIFTHLVAVAWAGIMAIFFRSVYAVTGAMPGRVMRYPFRGINNETLRTVLAMGVGFCVACGSYVLLLTLAYRFLNRSGAYELRVDRAAAEVAMKLLPEHVTLLGSSERIAASKKSKRRELFESLVPLGILVRLDDGFFEVTRFGKDVVRKVLQSQAED